MSMNNMGKEIPEDAKQRAYGLLKEIGLSDKQKMSDCVAIVSKQLELDKPYEAQKEAMRYVDFTGAYRLFAVLLTGWGDEEK